MYTNLYVINNEQELKEKTKVDCLGQIELLTETGYISTYKEIKEILKHPFPQYWIKSVDDIQYDPRSNPVMVFILKDDDKNREEILNNLLNYNCELIYNKKRQIEKIQKENDLIYKLL